MNEPNRYVVLAARFNESRYLGEYMYFIWAYTAADAKLQVELRGSQHPSIGVKLSIKSIEPYRKPGPFGDWEDNAVVER